MLGAPKPHRKGFSPTHLDMSTGSSLDPHLPHIFSVSGQRPPRLVPSRQQQSSRKWRASRVLPTSGNGSAKTRRFWELRRPWRSPEAIGGGTESAGWSRAGCGQKTVELVAGVVANGSWSAVQNGRKSSSRNRCARRYRRWEVGPHKQRMANLVKLWHQL